MNTPVKPQVQQDEEERPTVTFARIIEIAPSSASFGGWGPNVGITRSLGRWN